MTYDSGVFLKVNNGMLGMKYDGCGALGCWAMTLDAQRLPVRVALAVCRKHGGFHRIRPTTSSPR